MYRSRPDTGGLRLPAWSLTLLALCLAATAGAITPSATTAASSGKSERAYEMVTPADKPTRRGGFPAPDRTSYNIPLISVDGNRALTKLQFGVLSDPTVPWPNDYAISARSDSGWETHSIFSSGIHGGVIPGSLASVSGISPDLGTLTLSASTAFITPEHPLGSPPPDMTYSYTRFSDERGFQLWVTDPSQILSDTDRVNFSPDSSTMIRSGLYRGLLGPDDPSLQQLAGSDGGRTVYGMDLDTGSRYLVSECSGEGATATLVPERLPDGKLDAQPCGEDSPLNSRGATAGGLGASFGSNARATLNSPSDLSVSADGKTVVMTSPQRDNQPTWGTQGCTTATGPDTLCQPQVYVSRTPPKGKRFVRWISRPAVSGQDASLLGRGAAYEAMSRDGRRILFRTNAPLTADDPNGEPAPTPGGVKTGTVSPNSWDLYAYDLPADPEADPADGQLTRITAGPTGAADPNTNCTRTTGNGAAKSCHANAAGGVVRFMSDDGSRIYFVTASEIPGAVNTPPAGSSAGNVPQSGDPNPYVNTTSRNLYLWDESEPVGSRWRFVASLPAIMSGTNLEGCASLYSGFDSPVTGAGGGGDQLATTRPVDRNCVKGSPDGNHLLLFTNGRLTADDDDEAFDLFVYNRESDSLTRVTAPGADSVPYVCLDDGPVLCNGALGWSRLPRDERARHSNLTADGDVLFETRLSLLPEDTNGDRMDVYSWRDGKLSLISPGNSDDDAYYAANTIDGESIFFTTSQPIDRWREIDPGDYDVYVARVGGGFPPPEIPKLCDFALGSCAAPAAAAPVAASSATGEQRRGNQKPKKARCHAQRRQLRRSTRQAKRLRRAVKRHPRARRLKLRTRKQVRKVKRQRNATKRCLNRKGN